MNNNTFKKKWVLIIIALLIAAAVLFVVLRTGVGSENSDGGVGDITASDNKGNSGNDTDDTAADVGNGYVSTDTETVDTDSSTHNNGSTNSGNSGNGGSNNGSDNKGNSESNDSGSSDSGNDSENTGGNNNDNENDDEPVTQPEVEITQQADADYEKWLAATMVVCVSMEYPDFELAGIYSASETTMENRFSSDGAYVVFTSGGQYMAVHSVALSTERTKAGTRDISSQAIGFATFDVVDPSVIDIGSMTQLDASELEKLIEQSLLISVYTR